MRSCSGGNCGGRDSHGGGVSGRGVSDGDISCCGEGNCGVVCDCTFDIKRGDGGVEMLHGDSIISASSCSGAGSCGRVCDCIHRSLEAKCGDGGGVSHGGGLGSTGGGVSGIAVNDSGVGARGGGNGRDGGVCACDHWSSFIKWASAVPAFNEALTASCNADVGTCS